MLCKTPNQKTFLSAQKERISGPSQRKMHLLGMSARKKFICRKKVLSSSEGFTLLETLLAFVLGVLVLSSLLGIFFSFVQVWSGNSQQKEFRVHIDNVCDFLEKSFNGLSFPVEGWTEYPILWKRFANPQSAKTETVLSTVLREAPTFVQSANGFSTSVVVYFYHLPSKGLFMACEGNIWKKSDFSLSDVPKESYHKEIFRISPWISRWEYGYYDVQNQKWEFFEDAQKDKKTKKETLPDCLRVQFEQDSLREARYVRLRKINPLFIPEKAQPEQKQPLPDPKERIVE